MYTEKSMEQLCELSDQPKHLIIYVTRKSSALIVNKDVFLSTFTCAHLYICIVYIAVTMVIYLIVLFAIMIDVQCSKKKTL